MVRNLTQQELRGQKSEIRSQHFRLREFANDPATAGLPDPGSESRLVVLFRACVS